MYISIIYITNLRNPRKFRNSRNLRNLDLQFRAISADLDHINPAQKQSFCEYPIVSIQIGVQHLLQAFDIYIYIYMYVYIGSNSPKSFGALRQVRLSL